MPVIPMSDRSQMRSMSLSMLNLDALEVGLPAPDLGEGNPGDLVRLKDGRIVLIYGVRSEGRDRQCSLRFSDMFKSSQHPEEMRSLPKTSISQRNTPHTQPLSPKRGEGSKAKECE